MTDIETVKEIKIFKKERLGKQEKPSGLDLQKLDFYDNYIFRIGANKRKVYVHRLEEKLTYKYFKVDKWQDVFKLNKSLRLEIEEKVKEAKNEQKKTHI